MSTQISISPVIKLEVNTTPITGGSAGQILFQTTGNTVGESANLSWNNTNLIFTLGSTATRIFNFRPEDTTGTYGNSCSIRGGNGNGRLDFYSASNITEVRDNVIMLTSVSGPAIQVASYINLNLGGSTRLQVASTTGNILIGTTTDAGFKLDVNGTARTQQLHTFSQGTYLDANTSNNYHRVYTGASTYGGLQLQNEIVNYTGYITTGRSGNQLGINFFHTTYAGGVSASSHQKFTQGGVQFGSLSLPNTLTVFNVGGGNGTVNYPIVANNQLNTTNTGVGYLFQTGDSTGSGPINHAAISAWKTNGAAPSVTSSLRFYTINDAANSLTEKMRIADSGNILINTTTDAGFTLDVNGTARVVGSFIASAAIGAGTGSFALGTLATSASSTHGGALGYDAQSLNFHALAFGYSSRANGHSSVAIGRLSIANAADSVAFHNATSAGINSAAFGNGSTTTGASSMATGSNAYTYLTGQLAVSGGSLNYKGDSQFSIYTSKLNTGIVNSGGTYSFAGIRPSNSAFGSDVTQIWYVECVVVFAVKGRTTAITEFALRDTYSIKYKLAVKSTNSLGTTILGTPVADSSFSDASMATTSVTFTIVSNNLVVNVTPPTWTSGGQMQFIGTAYFGITELGVYGQPF